eukprot:9310499-Alexandrium_andersonii.AAC.1
MAELLGSFMLLPVPSKDHLVPLDCTLEKCAGPCSVVSDDAFKTDVAFMDEAKTHIGYLIKCIRQGGAD